MHLPRVIYTVVLTCVAQRVLAVPLPQLAGFGAACDSLLSSTDNGVGYGIENAEDNTAGLVTTAKGTAPLPARRQLAGEGAGCNSVLSSTDNGVGYGVENAEDNTANLVNGAKNTGVPGIPAVPGVPDAPPAPGAGGRRHRRQLDKIADGAGALGDALGVGAVSGPVAGEADTLDGQSTGDAALLGQQVGDDEAATLENAGALVP